MPVLGFGEAPILVALILYGLLPILRNTLAGLEGVDATVRQAALGMGMSPFQVLLQVELPLAGRVILAGIRTSVTINIATAAIASTIGARTGHRRAGQRQHGLCVAGRDSDWPAGAHGG